MFFTMNSICHCFAIFHWFTQFCHEAWFSKTCWSTFSIWSNFANLVFLLWNPEQAFKVSPSHCKTIFVLLLDQKLQRYLPWFLGIQFNSSKFDNLFPSIVCLGIFISVYFSLLGIYYFESTCMLVACTKIKKLDVKNIRSLKRANDLFGSLCASYKKYCTHIDIVQVDNQCIADDWCKV